MARTKRKDDSVVDDLVKLLKVAPIWVGPIIAAFVFAIFRWFLPWAFGATSVDDETGRTLTQVWSGMAAQFAPYMAIGVLCIWVYIEVNKWFDRRQLEQQTGADSISRLSWGEFESLLCEAFRRQGFDVEHSGGPSPDGGVDLRLSKAGAITLVQCKHWKQRQVGVKIVRELLGVVSSERSQGGIVVTSGGFSPDAVEFAKRNPIRLIDGTELAQMLSGVQKSGKIKAQQQKQKQPAASAATPAPVQAAIECPQCGAAMVERMAKKGPKAGSKFLGCSRYPACRGTRQLQVSES